MYMKWTSWYYSGISNAFPFEIEFSIKLIVSLCAEILYAKKFEHWAFKKIFVLTW